jgi:thiosulfate reductase/polysulfide reductase chain A
MRKIIRTVCQGCHPECGVLAHVEDGRVIKIEGDPEHPFSRGFICIKGRLHAESLYHPDRLRYPLKRAGERAGGKWERISWEQALDEIAEKLTAIKEKYGPESIATYHGTGPRVSISATSHLADALGTPNVISTDLHICLMPSMVAETFTIGHSVMMENGPDYLSANCILVIGGNPVVSHPPRGMDILEARRQHKAKLIVVDPRRISLAARADLWLQIRPQTDAALVLGMINTIIDEEIYDKEFVNKWCYGFDKLRERVREYSPEKVAEITWIPADKIREAARLYATTKPAVLHHRVAMEHNINSTQTSRALITLVALTGNIDVKGGNLLPISKGGHAATDLSHSRLPPEVEAKRIGSKEFPFIAGMEAPIPFVHSSLAAEAMLTGKPYPIKASYCAGGNPIVNMQNTRKIWRALQNLELHVVSDFFMTPTAELADYVLPAAIWLERDELCETVYMDCVSARQKVVEPLFECRDDRDIVIELVKRIPWADRSYLPWHSVDEWNESLVKNMGITFKDLKKQGYLTFPRDYRKYERAGFNTPTGKVELYSTIFEKYGYDPLPSFVEPAESPVSTPELMKDYPLILITGARDMEYYLSAGRQVPSLRQRLPDPELEMHPETASKAGIEGGDWVWVETPKIIGERIKLRVKLTDGIDPRVVHAPLGWWFPEKPAPEHGCFDSNISVLLSDEPPREPICGSVPIKGTLCKIYK